MKTKFMLFIIVIFSTMNTCTYNQYNPDVCFQKNILPIFVSKCSMNGCHNSLDRRGRNYSTYEGIMKDVVANHPLRSNVYTSVRGNNPSMPKGGKLSAKEVSYIEIWIRMGAHNTANCSVCDTSAVSYSNNIKPIFTDWCVGCHSSTNAGGGYDFSTYQGIVSSITNKRLTGSVQQSSGYSAMPQGSKLSDCDIKTIEKWLNTGYPNN